MVAAIKEDTVVSYPSFDRVKVTQKLVGMKLTTQRVKLVSNSVKNKSAKVNLLR